MCLLVREFVLCLFVKCVDCVNVNEIKDLLFLLYALPDFFVIYSLFGKRGCLFITDVQVYVIDFNIDLAKPKSRAPEPNYNRFKATQKAAKQLFNK